MQQHNERVICDNVVTSIDHLYHHLLRYIKLGKIQQIVIIKKISATGGKERNTLNKIVAIDEKPTPDSIFNSEKLKLFLSR